jgi:hypothetical protein
MFRLVELRDHRRNHAAHHAIRAFENRHLEPRFAARSGHFEADVAATDDDCASPAHELDAQTIDVGDAAQGVHAGELGTGQRQDTRMAAGGQQQPVILGCAAIGDFDAATGPVDPGRRKPQPKLHGMFGIVGGVTDQQPVALERAGEEFLGQWWALIGEQRLVAHYRDGSCVATLTQGFHRLRGSLSSADYDDSLMGHIEERRSPEETRTIVGRMKIARAKLVLSKTSPTRPMMKLPLCWAFWILARKLHCD